MVLVLIKGERPNEDANHNNLHTFDTLYGWIRFAGANWTENQTCSGHQHRWNAFTGPDQMGPGPPELHVGELAGDRRKLSERLHHTAVRLDSGDRRNL